MPLDGDTSAATSATGRPARIDDYSTRRGEIAARCEFGYRSAVVAPITVAGALWGAWSSRRRARTRCPRAPRRGSATSRSWSRSRSRAPTTRAARLPRARLVEASDETRRRIERDLHDGAQQRLVSLALALRLARRSCPGGGGRDARLGQALGELDQARGAARARPRHPSGRPHPARPAARDRRPRRALAGRGRPLRGPRERFAPAVEAAVYFLASEALTNAAKHARDARRRTRAARGGQRARGDRGQRP